MAHPRPIALTAVTLLVVSMLAGCSNGEGDSLKNEADLATTYTPRVGDVIFQSSGQTDLVQMIEGVSDSHYSHCGIVDQRDGQWVVYEAAQQVKATPLDAFTDRGRSAGFAAYRFKEAFRADIPTIIEKTRTYLNRPYDFRYRLDDEYIYCSELIYKAFEQTTGQTLGELARLGELDWRPYEQLIKQLEDGPVPLDREIITPIDLAMADQLEVVFSRDFEVTMP